MKHFLLVIFSFLILKQSSVEANSKELVLKHVTILFRHGGRAPISVYPNDPNPASYWDKYGGLSQITEKGILKSMEFGSYIRKRYNTFLSTSYNRNYLYARSTDIDRTLISAESFLAGLYPSSFIPIHTAIAVSDPLFNYDAPCPLLNYLRTETINSTEYIKVAEENADFIKNMSKLSGLNLDLNNLWKLSENLVAEKTEGLKIPDWASENYEKLLQLNYFSYWVVYGSLNKSRLVSGPLLNEVIKKNLILIFGNLFVNTQKVRNNFKNIVNNSSKLQMAVYANHDTYLAGITVLLNFSLPFQFEYSGGVIFELKHNCTDNKHYVLTYTKNNLYTEPISLTLIKINGCDYVCPLDRFMDLTDKRILFSSFTQECSL